MFTKLIVPTLLAASCVAMPCLADVNASGEVGYIQPFPSGPSTLTREQVVADLMKSLEGPAPTPPASTLTRAAVVAELMRALREGTVPPSQEGADVGLVAAPRPGLLEPQTTLAAR